MKKHLYRAVIVLLSLVMIISAFNIVSYYIEANTQEKIYNALIDSTKAEDNEDNLSSDSSGEPVILSKYSEIFKQNTDMVGWVKIEGTKINYPVMLSVNEPDFYLTHGFDKKYTVYGCPYVKEDCDVLAEGKLADIIMIDLKQPNMQPINNIAKNIVYSGSKQNVKMTMVNGKILYEDGEFFIGTPAEEIYTKANEIIDRMR